MKVLVIDTENLSPQIVETEGGPEEWYRLIKCSLIDIAERRIGGLYYDIISDDEALLKSGGKVTGLGANNEPMLVGNLVVCRYDPETGGEAGLTEMDIAHIKEHLIVLTHKDMKWLAIGGMNY